MKKLLVSFSGGETSAYMCYFVIQYFNLVWNDIKKVHEGIDPKTNEEILVVFVFANTGLENEETLEFTNKCDNLFGLYLTWVEAEVTYKIQSTGEIKHTEVLTTDQLTKKKGELRKHYKVGKRAFKRMFTYKRSGTRHAVTSFEKATRGPRLFEEMIMKYGIPNQAYPHCNRELKLQAIKSYVKSLGWKDYHTAIGIRNDEADRISKDRIAFKLWYPLIEAIKMTKPKINFWWSQQPFRLKLKHYQGNCKTCWKKSDNKLYIIAKEDPKAFKDFEYLEKKYKNYVPQSRDQHTKNINFYRNNKSTKDIFDNSIKFKGFVGDDSAVLSYQETLFEDESCDIFSECGIDN